MSAEDHRPRSRPLRGPPALGEPSPEEVMTCDGMRYQMPIRQHGFRWGHVKPLFAHGLRQATDLHRERRRGLSQIMQPGKKCQRTPGGRTVAVERGREKFPDGVRKPGV